MLTTNEAMRAPSPRLRGEGRGEGALQQVMNSWRVETPPHPDHRCAMIRPLPASGER